jgi:hypothetical protein
VNTIATLERVFLNTPDDETLACALSDALMEERSYNANEAASRLDELRDQARCAARLACAAKWLGDDSPYLARLHSRFRSIALLPHDAPIFVVLVEGAGRCWHPKHPSLAPSGQSKRTTFTVGCDYVLTWVKNNGEPADQDEAWAHLCRAR